MLIWLSSLHLTSNIVQHFHSPCRWYVLKSMATVRNFISCKVFIPLWILPTSFSALAAGAFCIQFSVQGAWGVVRRLVFIHYSISFNPSSTNADSHPTGGDVSTCVPSDFPWSRLSDRDCTSRHSEPGLLRGRIDGADKSCLVTPQIHGADKSCLEICWIHSADRNHNLICRICMSSRLWNRLRNRIPMLIFRAKN